MAPEAPAWRSLIARGLDQLSPPEVERVLFELPADRVEYVKTVQDMSDWPARASISRRVPGADEIAALTRTAGRWRAVVLLEDERAIALAAHLFTRVFVLDPLYDTSDLLYGAWHDRAVRDAHVNHLALHASHLVRLAPLLHAGTAVLAPDHLPGSWDPRPGWRRLRPDADARATLAWRLRQALVLTYWGDRLHGVVCASGLPLPVAGTAGRRVPRHIGANRRAVPANWRFLRGQARLPNPQLLLARALDGRDLDAQPLLPRTALRRQPLCLVAT